MFNVPPHLDLLSGLCKDLPSNYFSHAFVIGCQHILPSTHLMINKMIEHQLPKENIALMGKCYSTSRYSMKKMLEEGIYVALESIEYNSHESFDEKFSKDILFFLKNQITIKKIQPDQVIILFDDGGTLIEAMHDHFPEYKKVVAIEQTSAGYNRLKNKKINFPVVNIARSPVKLKVEYLFVAFWQVKRIKHIFNSINMSMHNKKFIIIGGGYAGRALYSRLKEDNINVKIYDIKEELSQIKGFQYFLGDFDVIIGATGEKFLSYDQYKQLKKGCVLINASSSDREFDAVNFRRNLLVNNNCHQLMVFQDIYLANSGFPINFAGEIFDTIPLHCIQLTCALLLAGTFNIHKESFFEKTGIVDLDPSIEQESLNNFLYIQENFFRGAFAVPS